MEKSEVALHAVPHIHHVKNELIIPSSALPLLHHNQNQRNVFIEGSLKRQSSNAAFQDVRQL